MRVGYSFDSC